MVAGVKHRLGIRGGTNLEEAATRDGLTGRPECDEALARLVEQQEQSSKN